MGVFSAGLGPYHSLGVPEVYHSFAGPRESPAVAGGPALPLRPAVVTPDSEATLTHPDSITTSNTRANSRMPMRRHVATFAARKTMNQLPTNTAASLVPGIDTELTPERYASRRVAPALAPALNTTKDADAESTTTGSDFTAPEELGTIKIEVVHVNKKETVAFGRFASTTAQIGSKAQEAVKDKSGGLLVR